MAGVWPNLDAADLEARVRTYINEVTASFFTQVEIWRWLSMGVKDIAQKTLCIRRVLDAVTANATRNVTTNAYKVLHVEYIPASERSRMLTKISPLQLDHVPIDNPAVKEPQYWYEFGNAIGIEPLPDAAYNLRLYVADIPKMKVAAVVDFYTAGDWAGAPGGNWTVATLYTKYIGAGADTGGTLTWSTAMTSGALYTLEFILSGVAGAVTIRPGITTAGVNVGTNGVHTQTILAAGTSLVFTVVASGSTNIQMQTLNIYKEADYAAVGDQTELPPAYQHLLVLFATFKALYKDRRNGPAQMIESIYNNELNYLRQNVVEVIPDGLNQQKYM